MEIERVKLSHFRNYDSLDLTFGPHINLIYGQNAQGKTNLLESLYVCGTSRSFRVCPDKEMIQKGYDAAHITMDAHDRHASFTIDLHLKQNERKGIAVNKIPVRKISELLGKVKFIVFSPDDMALIKGSPQIRRNFLDMEISQINQIYLKNLARYKHVLNQRNILLKEIKKNSSLEKTLDVWDEQIILYGCGIIKERKLFIDRLNSIVYDKHLDMTDRKEEIMIDYEPSVYAEQFADGLRRSRRRDLEFGTTHVGPHRDDFTVFVNDENLKKYGSQGQKRTAALSIKLSEIDLIREEQGENPVILLDDVFSELDEKRQEDLIRMIGDYQTIITCTRIEDFYFNFEGQMRFFAIKEGKAEESGGLNGTVD